MTRRVLTLVVLVLVPLCGCERPPTPGSHPTPSVEVGRRQSTLRDWVSEPPIVECEREAACPRVLSAAPNVTEICCAVGLADCLIGRTRYCAYPPTVETVPSIGALNDLNVEVLLELRPELILVAGNSRNMTQRLTRLGLSYESLPDVTLDDLFVSLERVGELTRRRETARLVADGVRADLEEVADRFAAGPRLRVLLLTGPLPDPPTQPFAAGPGSFYDDLLRRAGHTNAAEPSGRPFTPLSFEYILSADPDVIVELVPDLMSRPGGDADARRVWAKVGPLQAVARRRVHVLAGPRHFILGPRVAQTFEALCETIAGEHDE